ncbi:uncharacterized protein LOC132813124 [Hemiscyllium ocellatum]|uniref:uncharacterized protein LOC132813124 n=1 Tax=Hemiscyllium ocellatum TaxID=170820 RepID=UPI0029664F3D|nr:uncharacterized protein LOC132813124 [Hemiscyllium ocellatum]
MSAQNPYTDYWGHPTEGSANVEGGDLGQSITSPYTLYRGMDSEGPAREGTCEAGGTPSVIGGTAWTGGQERPQGDVTETQDREPTANAAQVSPLGAEQEGVLWELRARIGEINVELPEYSATRPEAGGTALRPESGSRLPTHPHSRYRGPWGEEGKIGNARNQSLFWRNRSEESEREGCSEQGRRENLGACRWDGDPSTQPTEGSLEDKMMRELIPELKMRIARLGGELPEVSEQKEEARETSISQGTPSETSSTSERKWPYWVGLFIFISIVVSAAIYLTVHFTQEDSD